MGVLDDFDSAVRRPSIPLADLLKALGLDKLPGRGKYEWGEHSMKIAGTEEFVKALGGERSQAIHTLYNHNTGKLYIHTTTPRLPEKKDLLIIPKWLREVFYGTASDPLPKDRMIKPMCLSGKIENGMLFYDRIEMYGADISNEENATDKFLKRLEKLRTGSPFTLKQRETTLRNELAQEAMEFQKEQDQYLTLQPS